jgi:RNA polymerase sigma factor (sigma-70 family)
MTDILNGTDEGMTPRPALHAVPGLAAAPSALQVETPTSADLEPADREIASDDPSDADLPLNVRQWTGEDFAKVYVRFRPALSRHARRWLQDPTDVDEVVQEAFLFLFLSMPELDSEIGALRYLKWKTRLLSLDLIRARSRRPVVGIDETAAASLADSTPGASDRVEIAEDAAIVRAAMAQLSPRHRQALLMAEFEEKSAKEIGEALDLDENAARQLLHRARKALRVALVGQLPADATSTEIFSVVVRRAADASKKAGKVALALLLVVSGIGFAMNRTDGSVKEIAGPAPVTSPSASPSASASAEPSARASVSATASAAAVSTPASVATASSIPAPVVTDDFQSRLDSTIRMFGRVSDSLDQIRINLGPVAWPGVDANGVPTGVTVSDGTSLGQALVLNQTSEIMLDGRIVTTSDVMTVSNGIDLMLSQSITRHLDGRIEYSMSPSVKINGVYRDLKVTSKAVSSRDLGSSQVLLEIWALVDTSALSATFTAPSLGGRELTSAPEAIGIRIHTTAIGQPIFAQSIYLVEVTK